MTIQIVCPSSERYSPRLPVTLQVGDVENFDFTPASIYMFCILNVLESVNLIGKNPYSSADEIGIAIRNVIDDIDLGNDELQISEHKHIRAEFRDELLALELYIGV